MARPTASQVLGTVTLITGAEEFLAERTIASVVSALRAADVEADVTEIPASELGPGSLAELTSPSLFAATRAVIVRGLQDLPKESAARLVASHFSLMTRQAQVLTGGPALVERALGESVSKEELGGAEVHSRSGVVLNLAEDEADAWRQIRAFLSYLPSNVWESAPIFDLGDPPGREEEELISIIPPEFSTRRTRPVPGPRRPAV